ncbi:MAG: flippase-like domain-containing protein, partial [Bacteroidaceae bacterium]|nr:flippase-like domain-containing protein [Bacteroidaceae bacterium]
MKKKYQNGFFIFGIVVLIVMLTQLNYAEVWTNLQRAGYWFFAIIGIWIFLYMINTLSWYLIIRSGYKEKSKIGYWWLYKLSITGFALNYATP